MRKTLNHNQAHALRQISMYGIRASAHPRTVAILIGRFGYVTMTRQPGFPADRGLYVTEAGNAWLDTHGRHGPVFVGGDAINNRCAYCNNGATHRATHTRTAAPNAGTVHVCAAHADRMTADAESVWTVAELAAA